MFQLREPYEPPMFHQASFEAQTGVGAAAVQTVEVVRPPSNLSYMLGAAGQGVFAYMLFKPLGFQTQHPVWGTLFALGSLFSLGNIR